jgi:hypothetical protein
MGSFGKADLLMEKELVASFGIFILRRPIGVTHAGAARVGFARSGSGFVWCADLLMTKGLVGSFSIRGLRWLRPRSASGWSGMRRLRNLVINKKATGRWGWRQLGGAFPTYNSDYIAAAKATCGREAASGSRKDITSGREAGGSRASKQQHSIVGKCPRAVSPTGRKSALRCLRVCPMPPSSSA